VKVHVCQSGPAGGQVLVSYVVNDTVCVDAGAVGFALPLAAQRRIRHVLLTHSHLDHVATLPMLIEHVCADTAGDGRLTVYGGTHTLQCLRRHLLNGQVYPDFFELAQTPGTPFYGRLRFEPLEPQRTRRLDDLTVTPVPVHHVVPCFAFLLEEPDAAVAMVSDTGPTDAVWTRLGRTPNLKAVFVEASFPNRLQPLADRSTHLTPQRLRGEIDKLKRDVQWLVVHVKWRYAEEVGEELRRLELPRLELAEPGRTYRW